MRKRNKITTKIRERKALFIALVAIIGIGSLILVSAATYFVATETESGTVAGGAQKISDNTASANSAVQFGQSGGEVVFTTEPGRTIPDTIYGLTTESVGSLNSLVDSVDRHTKTATTRIVFQNGDNPSYYVNSVDRLRQVGYVMGEILDSSSMKRYTTQQYADRTRQYVNQFGNNIDIWEIGNELNGEWLGTQADILAKTQAAYDVVEKENSDKNLRSAITLNYWPTSDCYAKSWENTETFANSIPTEVQNGVDYILLSFYETACSPVAHPTVNDVTNIMNKMKTIFPNAKVGFGEIGAQGVDDGFPAPSLAEKQRIANTYYGMHAQLKANLGSRYIGGYFWWYYFQDAVPYNKTNSMWPTIEANFNSY